jgi:hypothetical protein
MKVVKILTMSAEDIQKHEALVKAHARAQIEENSAVRKLRDHVNDMAGLHLSPVFKPRRYARVVDNFVVIEEEV